MRRLERKILTLAAAALLAITGGLAAQTSGAQETQPPKQPPPRARAVPHVTGTVTLWNGNRMDLKTPEGKMLKVAVNEYTKRLVEIRKGAEVTAEYRRKIGGFYIATRVLAAGEGAAAQPAAAPGSNLKTVTGSVVSGNPTELILRTSTGDITLFLSPNTQYEVKPLNPGALVTVEYRQGADGARVATRVLAGKKENGKENGSR